MKKNFSIINMYFVITALIITSCQSVAMEPQTSKGFIFTDLIAQGTEPDLKFKFCCDEITNIIGENKGARLATQLEAHEICEELDARYLCGIYDRSDFELTYQNFWISGDLPDQLLIFCPRQKNGEAKMPDKGEKCCLRLAIENNVVRADFMSKTIELANYAVECVSPYCTLQNAMLGVVACGAGVSGMYAYRYWYAAAKVGAVVVVINNVPGLRERLGNIWQLCSATCGNALMMCRLGFGNLPPR